MILRPATLISFALALGLGFGLFKVKYAVQAEDQQLVTIEDQIVTDQDAVHVLKAEWNQETQPDQLGSMAERHLALAPVQPAQLATYDSLPLRVPLPAVAPLVPTVLAPAAVASLPVPLRPTLIASAAEDGPGLDAMVHAIESQSAAVNSGAPPP